MEVYIILAILAFLMVGVFCYTLGFADGAIWESKSGINKPTPEEIAKAERNAWEIKPLPIDETEIAISQ